MGKLLEIDDLELTKQILTVMSFLMKKFPEDIEVGQYHSKFFVLAQGFGGKEGVTLANAVDSNLPLQKPILHFEYFSAPQTDSEKEKNKNSNEKTLNEKQQQPKTTPEKSNNNKVVEFAQPLPVQQSPEKSAHQQPVDIGKTFTIHTELNVSNKSALDVFYDVISHHNVPLKFHAPLFHRIRMTLAIFSSNQQTRLDAVSIRLLSFFLLGKKKKKTDYAYFIYFIFNLNFLFFDLFFFFLN